MQHPERWQMQSSTLRVRQLRPLHKRVTTHLLNPSALVTAKPYFERLATKPSDWSPTPQIHICICLLPYLLGRHHRHRQQEHQDHQPPRPPHCTCSRQQQACQSDICATFALILVYQAFTLQPAGEASWLTLPAATPFGGLVILHNPLPQVFVCWCQRHPLPQLLIRCAAPSPTVTTPTPTVTNSMCVSVIKGRVREHTSD